MSTRDLYARKDDTGNVLVGKLVILVLRGPKQPVGKSSTGSDCNRREQDLSSNIADRVDVFDICVLVLVRNDVACLFGNFDIDVLEPQLFSVGVTTDSPQQDVNLYGLLGGVGVHQEAIGGLLDLFDIGLLVNIYSRLFCIGQNR